MGSATLLEGPQTPNIDDEQLVARVRAGDERAFEEVVRRYRPALVRYAGGFLLDGRAEDVVQDALIRAHRAMLANDAEIQLRPWLYRIVHNGAISELRSTRPHEELDETINGVPQPPDIFERRENVRGVVARLKALPASQRKAIVASELEGTSHDQIAKVLGTTPGGVSQLIFRARASLRAGAAAVLPLPLLRWIQKLAGQSTTAETAAAAAGSGGAATGVVGVVASTGGAKLGAVAAATVLAVGGGAAIKAERDGSKGNGGDRKEVAVQSSTANQASAESGSAGGGAQRRFSRQPPKRRRQAAAATAPAASSAPPAVRTLHPVVVADREAPLPPVPGQAIPTTRFRSRARHRRPGMAVPLLMVRDPVQGLLSLGPGRVGAQAAPGRLEEATSHRRPADPTRRVNHWSSNRLPRGRAPPVTATTDRHILLRLHLTGTAVAITRTQARPAAATTAPATNAETSLPPLRRTSQIPLRVGIRDAPRVVGLRETRRRRGSSGSA